jgi:hypothetical protein
MSPILRSAALAVVITAASIGSVFAGPGLSTNATTSLSPSFTQQKALKVPLTTSFTQKRMIPCISHEVLDRARSAFYDSCTGAFIRAAVN